MTIPRHFTDAELELILAMTHAAAEITQEADPELYATLCELRRVTAAQLLHVAWADDRAFILARRFVEILAPWK